MLQIIIATIDERTGFARWGPDSNPLIVHLKHQDRETRFSLRRTIWIAFFLGMLGLVGSTWDVMQLSPDNAISKPGSFLLSAGWVITVTAPLFATLIAAWRTSRVMQPERFDLVYMSPLSNHTLIHAYIFNVIYRFRHMFAILIVLFPPIVIYTLASILVAISIQYQTLNSNYGSQSPEYLDVVGQTLLIVTMILSLWGQTLLGIAWGVRMAVFRQGAFKSVLAAFAGMVVIMAMPYMLCCTCIFVALPADGYVMVCGILCFFPALSLAANCSQYGAPWTRLLPRGQRENPAPLRPWELA